MTEQEFIQQESNKIKVKLQRQLRKIDKTGHLSSRKAEDVLWSNLLIELCGPREGIPYNNYRLTEEGKKLLIP